MLFATNTGLRIMDKIGDLSYGHTSLYQNIYSSLGSDTAVASAILNECFLNRFWASGFGQWEDADRKDGINGYKYDSYGFMLGYDRAFGPVIAGASFVYANGDYEDKNAISHNSDIDSYSFNLYATYNHHSGFFGSLFGGYTYSDNDIDETYAAAFRAKEDYHTDTWYGGAKVGYQKRVGNLIFTPTVGLAYINSRSSSHATGVNGIDLVRIGRVKAILGWFPSNCARDTTSAQARIPRLP